MKCPACDGNNHKFLFKAFDSKNFNNDSTWDIVQCQNCKLVFISPFLTRDEWLKYIKTGNLYRSSVDDTSAEISRIRGLSGNKLLDIGCGNGTFLYNSQKLGWDVTGIELFEGENPYDLPIKYGAFEDIDLPENYFDLITFWGVTEYLLEPVKFFEKVKRLLTDRGQILFLISNYYSIQRQVMKLHNFPRQQLLWSKPAIEHVLNKTGFKIKTYDYRNDIRNGRCTEWIVFLFKKYILHKSDRQILVEHNTSQLKKTIPTIILKIIDRAITIPLSAILGFFGYNGVITIVACPNPVNSVNSV